MLPLCHTDLISDLDVVRAGIRVGPNESAAARALEPMISVDASTALSAVGEFMLKHRVSHLVVIDSVTQRPTGVPLDSRGHRRARVGRGMTGTPIACSARS